MHYIHSTPVPSRRDVYHARCSGGGGGGGGGVWPVANSAVVACNSPRTWSAQPHTPHPSPPTPATSYSQAGYPALHPGCRRDIPGPPTRQRISPPLSYFPSAPQFAPLFGDATVVTAVGLCAAPIHAGCPLLGVRRRRLRLRGSVV
jgi:hypothetical protein